VQWWLGLDPRGGECVECPRCGTFNHLKTQSLPTDRRERHPEGSTNENQLIHGDALNVLPILPAGGFDALIRRTRAVIPTPPSPRR